MQKNISLTAVLVNGSPCNTCNCQHRADFINLQQEVIVTEYDNGTGVVIKTPKGEYQIPKHTTMNSYHGNCGQWKVRVTLKKMVGTLTYWAS